MKKTTTILLLVLSTPLLGSVNKKVKCRGYLIKEDKKVRYVLKGKILSELGEKEYLIYGFSPALGNKALHKVKKVSCVNQDESFVAKTERKVVEVEVNEIVKKAPQVKPKADYKKLDGIPLKKEKKNSAPKEKSAPKKRKSDPKKTPMALADAREKEVKDILFKDKKEPTRKIVVNSKKEIDSKSAQMKTFADYLDYIKESVLK